MIRAKLRAKLQLDVQCLIGSCVLVLASLTPLRAQNVIVKGIEDVEIGTGKPQQDISFFSKVMGLSCLGNRCSVGVSQHLTFVASTEKRGAIRSITLSSVDPVAMRAQCIRNHVAVGELQRDKLAGTTFSLTDPDGNLLLIRNASVKTPQASGVPETPPISHHLRHVAIPVKSLEAAEAFYVGELGFHVVGRTYRQGKPGWVNVAMGEATGDFLQLALVESGKPREDASTVEHLCFDVLDAYEARQAIVPRVASSHAIRAPVIGLAKFRKVMISDPDGTPIELMEMALAVQKPGEHVE